MNPMYVMAEQLIVSVVNVFDMKLKPNNIEKFMYYKKKKLFETAPHPWKHRGVKTSSIFLS